MLLPETELSIYDAQKRLVSKEKFISSLKIHILRLRIHVLRLEIHILSLRINFIIRGNQFLLILPLGLVASFTVSATCTDISVVCLFFIICTGSSFVL